MKRNRMMRIASFLLIAVLATTCAISGTFAKYTTDYTGEATATVAKWDVKFTDGANALDEEADFKLFNTILDQEGDAAETDVVTGKIAPGTKGSFTIVVNYNSEVNATYSLTLTDTAGDIPIEYCVDGTNWVKFESTALTLASGSFNFGATPTVLELDIQWRWLYDGNDAVDTAAGVAASTFTTTVKLNVTQKN